jgi:hypothetical protein
VRNRHDEDGEIVIMRRRWLVSVPLLAFTLSACVGHTATPAAHGKAYVVVGSVFGSDTYFCEVRGGQPECWQVIEQEVKP